MITGYFGVPRSGKSTLLTMIAQKELRKKRYDNIYCINIDISGCKTIPYDYLKIYKPKNSLILIDEITLDADSRNFKNFTNEEKEFYKLHGHLHNDIIYVTQDFEGVDKVIRSLTQELWYMSKSVVPFLTSFTRAKRIYRTININEHTSDLVMGYRFCNFLESIFVKNNKFVYRKRWYKYFDSFAELGLSSRAEMPDIPITPYKESKFQKLKGVLRDEIRNRRRKNNKRPDDGLNYY